MYRTSTHLVTNVARALLGWTGRGSRLVATVLMVLAWMGSLSAPLYAQGFAHIDPLFFSKGYGGANPLPQVLTVTSSGAPIGFTASASTSTGGDWLTVSTTEDCCMTPAPVSVLVNASAALAAGSYSGQVVFTGNGSSLVVEVHLVVTPADAATFDKTPSQLSFSMMPGGRASPQVMRISAVGGETLQWRMIAATFNGADFLSVSAQTGKGPTRITVGVLPEKLPNAGATAGVYTGQLLFLSASSTVTIPVSVRVGDTESGPVEKSPREEAGRHPIGHLAQFKSQSQSLAGEHVQLLLRRLQHREYGLRSSYNRARRHH